MGIGMGMGRKLFSNDNGAAGLVRPDVVRSVFRRDVFRFPLGTKKKHMLEV